MDKIETICLWKFIAEKDKRRLLEDSDAITTFERKHGCMDCQSRCRKYYPYQKVLYLKNEVNYV